MVAFAMTVLDVCDARVREAQRRFTYVKDPEGVDPISRLLNDEWDTAAEMEQRGAGDCDGFVGWCIERGEEDEAELPHARGDTPAEWWAIFGEIQTAEGRRGHMWIELVTPDGTFWADPTWGRVPTHPEALGYDADRAKATRWPLRAWRYKGWGQFGDQQEYAA